ncbi:MAG: DUF2175 family protein [Candidatus Thermoplasmatota archaeon]|nr:DUF2175 family protein [Candidatus Thermoplasmatota archaeon]
MAEFSCYICNKKVITGEKFTFTKSGAVHYDCFIHVRRKEVPEEKQAVLRQLAILLDVQLTYLLQVLQLKQSGIELEAIFAAYKNIEKECGETTRQISSL